MMEERAAWSRFFRDMRYTAAAQCFVPETTPCVQHAHANSHLVTVRTTVAFCCRRKRAISRPGHVAASHAFHYDNHRGNLVEGDHGPLPDLQWYWYDTISDIPQEIGRYWW